MAVHTLGKPTMFIGAWDPVVEAEQVALITQPGVVEHLVRECERVYGELVHVERSCRVVGGRICDGEITVETADSSQITRTFDLVVGADGLWSVARSLMQQQVRTVTGLITAAACMRHYARPAAQRHQRPGLSPTAFHTLRIVWCVRSAALAPCSPALGTRNLMSSARFAQVMSWLFSPKL